MTKNIVITGTNRGIGLELAKQYSENKDKVYALCRKSSNELKKLDVKVIENVDVDDIDSIKRALSEIEHIDVLINNAGIMRTTPLQDFNQQVADNIMEQFKINAVCALQVTALALSKLSSGSKVVVITSRMGSMADNDSGGSYGYRMSKAAANAAFKSLSIDLKEKGISVALLHPGWVKTDMTNNSGLIDTTESAQGLRARVEELNLENSGTFWHSNSEILPW